MVAAGAVLLDVTPPARAEQSLIEGRTHIPVGELAERMGELPRDRDIVVYCNGGGASPGAAARLQAAGYRAFVMGARRNWDL
jgi:rhodanese-related sulfurtransferase